MAKWFVRVLRFDGSKGSEHDYSDYNKAKEAYDAFEKLSDEQRDAAGGRVKIQNNNGVTVNTALIA
jgi:hypothetical protein